MEDTEWDEDVDFPHTQLFECPETQDVLKNDREQTIAAVNSNSFKSACHRVNAWWNSVDKVRLLMCDDLFLKTVDSDVVPHRKDVYCIQLFIAEIFDSDTLTEDDAAFLASVFGERRDAASTVDESKEEWSVRRELENRWPTLVFALSYTAYRCSTCNLFPKSSLTIDRVVAFAFLAAVAKEFTAQYLSYRARSRFHSGLSSTKSFLRLSSTFLRSLKKSVNFLHEIEVIGRGFLLTVSGASLSSLDQSKLMKGLSTFPKSCRCESLRISLLRSIRKVIHVCRTATRKLLDNFLNEIYKCPLKNDVDHKSHYIAFIDIEEFGPLMTTTFEGEDELIRVTDNLSISAIKSLSHLCLIQMSEFLRRFVLCFSEFKLKRSTIQGTFDVTSEILNDVRSELVRVIDDVRLSHEFHENVSTIKESSDGIKSAHRPSKWDFTDRGGTRTALRSLSLHLQVALCRVHELSDYIEERFTIEDSVQTQNNSCRVEDSVVIDSLEDKMSSIDQDLRSCQACYDESLLKLAKLWHKPDIIETPSDPVIISKPESGVPVLSASVKTDMAPEDQVFEGYVNEAEVFSDVVDYADCDIELRKKSEDEKEASRRMFVELKTVLISKSEEWKQREARVLAAMKPVRNSLTSAHHDECNRQSDVTDDNDEDPTVSGERNVPGCSRSEVNNSEDIGMTPSLSIAAMAAARSRMWNLNSTADTFQSADVEEEFADDSNS